MAPSICESPSNQQTDSDGGDDTSTVIRPSAISNDIFIHYKHLS